MIVARALSESDRILSTVDGNSFVIKPGLFVGLLSILPFCDQNRSFPLNRVIQLTYAIGDYEESVYRYSALLKPITLWPGNGIVANSAQGRFSPHARIQQPIDFARYPVIEVATEAAPSIVCKECDAVDMLFRESDTGLDARLTAIAHGQSILSLDYHIPLNRLLWRNAPAYHENEIEAEASDCVDLVKIGDLSSALFRAAIKPGPIFMDR